jgi:hypothetical protein
MTVAFISLPKLAAVLFPFTIWMLGLFFLIEWTVKHISGAMLCWYQGGSDICYVTTIDEALGYQILEESRDATDPPRTCAVHQNRMVSFCLVYYPGCWVLLRVVSQG